mmetsp:Transcript_31666/g.72613  ORF Transcript_31666/g.72613 Transcript_31666/m.72613 type:complete len:214 (-) Transcript_31666:281-922(-)
MHARTKLRIIPSVISTRCSPRSFFSFLAASALPSAAARSTSPSTAAPSFHGPSRAAAASAASWCRTSRSSGSPPWYRRRAWRTMPVLRFRELRRMAPARASADMGGGEVRKAGWTSATAPGSERRRGASAGPRGRSRRGSGGRRRGGSSRRNLRILRGTSFDSSFFYPSSSPPKKNVRHMVSAAGTIDGPPRPCRPPAPPETAGLAADRTARE